jgi:hypothetical protein
MGGTGQSHLNIYALYMGKITIIASYGPNMGFHI